MAKAKKGTNGNGDGNGHGDGNGYDAKIWDTLTRGAAAAEIAQQDTTPVTAEEQAAMDRHACAIAFALAMLDAGAIAKAFSVCYHASPTPAACNLTLRTGEHALCKACQAYGVQKRCDGAAPHPLDLKETQ